MSSDQPTEQESAEAWTLVDMMQNIIANARDAPHYTAEEHALMGAGEIQREWLATHDAHVRRDAALHEKQRIAGEVRLWASVSDGLNEPEQAQKLRDVASDIDRIPEETP